MSNLEIIKKFPKNFIFGTATSSYQIEGQKFGGCGLSNWDTFAKKKGKLLKDIMAVLRVLIFLILRKI